MTTAIKSYRDLIVWQRAIDLAVAIYKVTESFPREEQFGLTSQMRRAAVSIASNIAEGKNRSTRKDFLHFLFIAYSSGAELETQLYIAKCLPKMKELDYKQSDALLLEIMKMLNSMISKLKTIS